MIFSPIYYSSDLMLIEALLVNVDFSTLEQSVYDAMNYLLAVSFSHSKHLVKELPLCILKNVPLLYWYVCLGSMSNTWPYAINEVQ